MVSGPTELPQTSQPSDQCKLLFLVTSDVQTDRVFGQMRCDACFSGANKYCYFYRIVYFKLFLIQGTDTNNEVLTIKSEIHDRRSFSEVLMNKEPWGIYFGFVEIIGNERVEGEETQTPVWCSHGKNGAVSGELDGYFCRARVALLDRN